MCIVINEIESNICNFPVLNILRFVLCYLVIEYIGEND